MPGEAVYTHDSTFPPELNGGRYSSSSSCYPCGKGESLIIPITGLGSLGKQHPPASTAGRRQDFWHPVPSPLVQLKGRIKLLLLPAEATRPRHRPAPSPGSCRWRLGNRGQMRRRREVGCARVTPPRYPHSRQVKATGGRRAGDPLIPAHDGYLRVLLSQLLVLPLQLCGGHGLPRPVQARLPGPLSPASHPQPPTRSRVRLRQRLSAWPTPRLLLLLLHFRVRPGAGRPPEAEPRLNVTAPPSRARAHARAASLARRGSAPRTRGRHLDAWSKMATSNGDGESRGEENDERTQNGRGTEERAAAAKSRRPEEETF